MPQVDVSYCGGLGISEETLGAHSEGPQLFVTPSSEAPNQTRIVRSESRVIIPPSHYTTLADPFSEERRRLMGWT